jgi:hypothetical protein
MLSSGVYIYIQLQTSMNIICNYQDYERNIMIVISTEQAFLADMA